ncbi:hypothetical protein HK097_008152 [Rhizophlyctis rosea]|uniref:CCHC-type domain-containing protein n=1 Tax=Rhizophlyctis rosea TaxID=64517 RepID=A0AAD5X180_9FUNG|nr:hypothetical protein HK097_008152 [Rhizophlyctis rosea]
MAEPEPRRPTALTTSMNKNKKTIIHTCLPIALQQFELSSSQLEKPIVPQDVTFYVSPTDDNVYRIAEKYGGRVILRGLSRESRCLIKPVNLPAGVAAGVVKEYDATHRPSDINIQPPILNSHPNEHDGQPNGPAQHPFSGSNPAKFKDATTSSNGTAPSLQATTSSNGASPSLHATTSPTSPSRSLTSTTRMRSKTWTTSGTESEAYVNCGVAQGCNAARCDEEECKPSEKGQIGRPEQGPKDKVSSRRMVRQTLAELSAFLSESAYGISFKQGGDVGNTATGETMGSDFQPIFDLSHHVHQKPSHSGLSTTSREWSKITEARQTLSLRNAHQPGRTTEERPTTPNITSPTIQTSHYTPHQTPHQTRSVSNIPKIPFSGIRHSIRTFDVYTNLHSRTEGLKVRLEVLEEEGKMAEKRHKEVVARLNKEKEVLEEELREERRKVRKMKAECRCQFIKSLALLDKDKRGYIQVKDLKATLLPFGLTGSEEKYARVARHYDPHRTGILPLSHFLHLLGTYMNLPPEAQRMGTSSLLILAKVIGLQPTPSEQEELRTKVDPEGTGAFNVCTALKVLSKVLHAKCLEEMGVRGQGHNSGDSLEPENCRRCGEEGHQQRDCPQPDPNVVCRHCNQTGHQSADCDLAERRNTCRRCREALHEDDDIPQPDTRTSREPREEIGGDDESSYRAGETSGDGALATDVPPLTPWKSSTMDAARALDEKIRQKRQQLYHVFLAIGTEHLMREHPELAYAEAVVPVRELWHQKKGELAGDV